METAWTLRKITEHSAVYNPLRKPTGLLSTLGVKCLLDVFAKSLLDVGLKLGSAPVDEYDRSPVEAKCRHAFPIRGHAPRDVLSLRFSSKSFNVETQLAGEFNELGPCVGGTNPVPPLR